MGSSALLKSPLVSRVSRVVGVLCGKTLLFCKASRTVISNPLIFNKRREPSCSLQKSRAADGGKQTAQIQEALFFNKCKFLRCVFSSRKNQILSDPYMCPTSIFTRSTECFNMIFVFSIVMIFQPRQRDPNRKHGLETRIPRRNLGLSRTRASSTSSKTQLLHTRLRNELHQLDDLFHNAATLANRRSAHRFAPKYTPVE